MRSYERFEDSNIACSQCSYVLLCFPLCLRAACHSERSEESGVAQDKLREEPDPYPIRYHYRGQTLRCAQGGTMRMWQSEEYQETLVSLRTSNINALK